MRQRIIIRNEFFDTYPMVYHEGESLKRKAKFLNKLSKIIFSMPKMELGCPEELTIVTWSNYKTPTVLEQTCQHLGIPLKVYGRNIKDWTSNYECKLKLAYIACCKEKTKYIMALDSRDIIILSNPKEILNEFKSINTKMLIGAEINPRKIPQDIKKFWDNIPEAKIGPFRYLNAGQWIAEREFAKQFFEQALKVPPRKKKIQSDQLVLSHTLCYSQKNFYPSLKLDYTCRIFQVAGPVDPINTIKESNNKEKKGGYL